MTEDADRRARPWGSIRNRGGRLPISTPLREVLERHRRRAGPLCLGLVVDPGEQATVARARALRAEGRSLRGVAAELVAEGRRPRNGGAWAIQTIRRLVALS